MTKHDWVVRTAWILMVLVLILAGMGTGFAASFSATMVETQGDQSRSGPFFVQEDQYRMDLVQEDRTLVILVDRGSGKTRLLVPTEGVYVEMENSDMQSLINNPFEAHQHMIDMYEVRSDGDATIDGIACDKQVIAAQGKDVMTAWIAKPYGFPIKLENQMNGSRMELKEIQAGSHPAGRFDIPAGFKLAASMSVTSPEWAADIAGAPVVTPPFERNLDAGQILRIKPVRDFDVELQVESLSGLQGAFSSNAFKGGRPLKSIAGFAGGGRKIHKESPDEADDIVVRAQSGKIIVRAQLVEAPEGIILVKHDLKSMSGRELHPEDRKPLMLRLTDKAGDGGDSRGTITFYKGRAQHKQLLNKEDFRLADGQARIWRHDAGDGIGTIHLMLLGGGVDARLEQPAEADFVPPSWAETPATPAAAPGTSVSAIVSAPAETAIASGTRSSAAVVSGPARMVLVLDGSGSMWGQIEGQAKIAIAKSVMADLIDQIAADFQTGLIVYGHRRKGDCDDIEMLMPVGPHNPEAMKAKVQAISPKGKTPLSEAVRQAAQALRYTEDRATVVLVSDGLETCDVDPCELAAELAMGGVDFTVHVIGFDISQEDQDRLRCLADKTGGLFLAADSAGALRDALFATVAQVKEPPPPVVADPGTATLAGPPSVPAGSAFKVQWDGPDSRDDFIAIAEKGSKDLRYRDYAYTKKGNPAAFVAPGDVGDYELRYVHAHTRKVIGRSDIKVTPIQANLQAPASTDVAVEFEVVWQGPAYSGDYISIARPDQRPGSYVNYTYTRDGSPLKVRAPSEPGTYEVRYIMGRGDKLLAKAAIEIKGVGASLDAPPVADVVTEVEVGWQGPDNKEDYISVARPDQRPGSYVNFTYTRDGSPLKVRAPSEPGTYEVRYILGRGDKLLASTPIEIKAVTAQVQASASADVATEFEVTWQGPGNKEDYISVARLDQGPGSYVNYTYTRDGSPLKVRAPSDPGTYEIRYILGRGNKLLAQTTIEIKAVSAQVQAPASADMATEFEVVWQGPANKDDYISVARPDQGPGSYVNYTYTRDGSPLKVRAPSDPGSYEVRYILGRGNKLLAQTTIEIKAVSANLLVPTSVKAGETFEVGWRGPDNQSDYISIALPDQGPGSYKGYTYTSRGSPAKVKAPKEPGTYEVRYILGRGSKLLDKKTILIIP